MWNNILNDLLLYISSFIEASNVHNVQSSEMLVNKYWYEIFTSDKYWKSHAIHWCDVTDTIQLANIPTHAFACRQWHFNNKLSKVHCQIVMQLNAERLLCLTISGRLVIPQICTLICTRMLALQELTIEFPLYMDQEEPELNWDTFKCVLPKLKHFKCLGQMCIRKEQFIVLVLHSVQTHLQSLSINLGRNSWINPINQLRELQTLSITHYCSGLYTDLEVPCQPRMLLPRNLTHLTIAPYHSWIEHTHACFELFKEALRNRQLLCLDLGLVQWLCAAEITPQPQLRQLKLRFCEPIQCERFTTVQRTTFVNIRRLTLCFNGHKYINHTHLTTALDQSVRLWRSSLQTLTIEVGNAFSYKECFEPFLQFPSHVRFTNLRTFKIQIQSEIFFTRPINTMEQKESSFLIWCKHLGEMILYHSTTLQLIDIDIPRIRKSCDCTYLQTLCKPLPNLCLRIQ